jgi:excisionase family DNA binding protein
LPRLAYRVREVAAMLGVPAPTLYRKLKDGTIRGSRIGSVIVIAVDELERLLRSEPSTKVVHD